MAENETKQGGRIVKRWVAECEFVTLQEGKQPHVAELMPARRCAFNDRRSPALHATFERAERESIQHALDAGHIGAREVQVRRTYTPRTIASEEVVA